MQVVICSVQLRCFSHAYKQVSVYMDVSEPITNALNESVVTCYIFFYLQLQLILGFRYPHLQSALFLPHSCSTYAASLHCIAPPELCRITALPHLSCQVSLLCHRTKSLFHSVLIFNQIYRPKVEVIFINVFALPQSGLVISPSQFSVKKLMKVCI